MRKLTAKQKKLLKEQFELNGVESVDDLKPEAYRAIDSINPCEIFWQNADHYLSELATEAIRNKNPWEY